MKIKQIISRISEGFINGVWNGDKSSFTAKLIHETTPQAAESIRVNGFRGNPEGIFFNLDDTGYSGGGYGGVKVICTVSGPTEGILNIDSDELPDDLEDFADGHEMAAYAKKRGYWAWKDDLQLAVLKPQHIQILRIVK